MARIDEHATFDEKEIRAAERPLRTEGRGDLATVWFEASWTSGPPTDDGPTVDVRGEHLG